jgi:hypothetical protein
MSGEPELYWMGKKVTDMTIEELIKALRHLDRLYRKALQDSIDVVQKMDVVRRLH